LTCGTSGTKDRSRSITAAGGPFYFASLVAAWLLIASAVKKVCMQHHGAALSVQLSLAAQAVLQVLKHALWTAQLQIGKPGKQSVCLSSSRSL
jgi:hypothetical protein